jgi:hypothetical protein
MHHLGLHMLLKWNVHTLYVAHISFIICKVYILFYLGNLN